MREKYHSQVSLDYLPTLPPTALSRLYDGIGKILSETPSLFDKVFQDLTEGVAHPDAGRGALTAEQVLRCTVVKQIEGWSYRDLADHISDSVTLRRFCFFGEGAVPSFMTLQDNIKRLKPETLEAVNRAVVALATKKKVETGEIVRIDCTGVETDVHHPTDNSLLWDCVRVATRLAGHAIQAAFPQRYFPNRQKIVKRLHFQIVNAKGPRTEKIRSGAFRRLFAYSEEVVEELKKLEADLIPWGKKSLEIEGLRKALADLLPLFRQVLDQGRRRVLKGEKLPAADKMFSIFEPHTDVIVKGDRDPVFGHKICLETGKSGLVLHCTMPRGNPGDSSLFPEMVAKHKAQFGKAPRQITTDGGFASKANLAAATEGGVKQVLFTKGKGRSAAPLHTQMSAWVKKRLAGFRAGIEGNISTLKRAFGLTRCTWEGWPSFQSYVWASILGYNLCTLARASWPNLSEEEEGGGLRKGARGRSASRGKSVFSRTASGRWSPISLVSPPQILPRPANRAPFIGARHCPKRPKGALPYTNYLDPETGEEINS